MLSNTTSPSYIDINRISGLNFNLAADIAYLSKLDTQLGKDKIGIVIKKSGKIVYISDIVNKYARILKE